MSGFWATRRGGGRRAAGHRLAAPLLAAVLAAISPGAFAGGEGSQDGYWALLADGTEVSGTWRDLRVWDEPRKLPAMGGKFLLDPNNPVRLLRDMTCRPKGLQAGPAVFFANGDVLPGRVVGYRDAESARNLPARLLVAPSDPIGGVKGHGGDDDAKRRGSGGGEVVVRADCVVRVVLGARRPEIHEGGALFYADGRRRAVTAVRWAPDGVRGLDEEGIVACRFAELSEIQAPGADAAAAVLADAASPGLGDDGWLCRAETVEGALLTFRQAATRPYPGRYDDHETVLHSIQPSWSLTPLTVPDAAMAMRSWRRATEIPLSLLPAETLAQKTFTGFVWPWRRNRSVRGEPLQAGTYSSDLGVGTHSYSEVAFTLPAGAKRFSCWVGLDAAVGAGGCVRCRIAMNEPRGKVLWQGPTIVGTGKPLRVGPIDVAGATKLVLITEYAHDGRPEGADPADIRDELDWLLPLVTVDPSSLAASRADAARWIPALAGWAPGEGKPPAIGLERTTSSAWEIVLDVPAEGLSFSRRLRPTIAAGYIDIEIARAADTGGHVVDLLVDGRPAAPASAEGPPALRTRDRGRGQAAWRRWSLQDYIGREIVLTVRALPDEKKDGRGLILRGLAVQPLVQGMAGDGKLPRPDVPLSQAKATEVLWHSGRDAKRPTSTSVPAPATAALWGLTLNESYVVNQGLNMTFELDRSWGRFVAVVGSENRSHRGPFCVVVDGKELWRSDSEILAAGQCQQVDVAIPPGAKTISLKVEHNMTSGVWGSAGFMKRE